MINIEHFLSNFTLIYSLGDISIPNYKYKMNNIYLISDNNNFFYVGQTSNIFKRIQQHKSNNTCNILSSKSKVFLLEENENSQTINVLEKIWIYWFMDNWFQLENKQKYYNYRFYPKEFIKTIECNYNTYIYSSYNIINLKILPNYIYNELKRTIFYSYDINQLIYLFNKYPKAYKDFVSSTIYNKRYYITELAKQMKKLKLRSKCKNIIYKK
jgi:hypothetical protein